ncbi:phosphohistidine phosphatase [Pontibacter ummariensis]|uniref:Phosphohistidine phosphatase n=1 Tax=Pontibacter ummariensis TaxID=1610492 RepID=A0A239IHE5_9BACT|nr:histidine phosphatase family protein [Pontibacter ummariensis]PRY09850.1 phosphohistidine phosphatase [Pontibacter ummariensis]SNS92981.1 phosphohistidine phosphatase [Pontibacter ummariensis]
MKKLYILRHAKSSWKYENLSDHDRPLKKRGRKDAPLMGQELAARGVMPDLIISSPAVRALSTATLVAHEMEYDPDNIRVDERLYGADTDDLLEVVQKAPADIKSLMIVGHNETITEFANLLSQEVIARLPTTGVVGLSFDCDSWDEIGKENATLLFYDFPKNYK